MTRTGILSPYKTANTSFYNTKFVAKNYTTTNIGNMMFKYATSKHVLDYIPIHASMGIQKIRSLIDILVMPVANQINPYTDLLGLANFIEKLNLPIVVIGIGAQSNSINDINLRLKTGTVKYLKVISKLSYKIGVRGEFTANLFNDYGVQNVEIIGCPSNFINPRIDIGDVIENKLKYFRNNPLNIKRTGFYPQLAHNAIIDKHKLSEIFLYELCQSSSGFFILNNPIELISIARGRYNEVPKEVLHKLHTFLAPNKKFITFYHDLCSMSITFTTIKGWMEFSSSLDLTIGKRIHGCINTTQSSNLGILIKHDSRTDELSETIGLPRIDMKIFENSNSIIEILQLTHFSGEEYNLNRKNLLTKYSDILHKSNVPITKFMKDLLLKYKIQ